MPYLTPNRGDDDTPVYRQLVVPPEYLEIVSGAIQELIKEYNWEKLGDITVSEAIVDMNEIYQQWLESEGMPFGNPSNPQGTLYLF